MVSLEVLAYYHLFIGPHRFEIKLLVEVILELFAPAEEVALLDFLEQRAFVYVYTRPDYGRAKEHIRIVHPEQLIVCQIPTRVRFQGLSIDGKAHTRKTGKLDTPVQRHALLRMNTGQ